MSNSLPRELPMTAIRRFASAVLALFVVPVHALDPALDAGHSYANTKAFRTTHAALDLIADFDHRRLKGWVDLTFERVAPNARQLILDTRDLSIASVQLQGSRPATLPFKVGNTDAILGAPLEIELPPTLTAKT